MPTRWRTTPEDPSLDDQVGVGEDDDEDNHRDENDENAAYPGRGPNARGPKPSVGPKSVETVVAAAVPAQSQGSVQRVDRGRGGRHLPRFLSHLGYYVSRSHLSCVFSISDFKKVTMPRLAGPSKVDDPRSPILASPHTWKEGFLLQENSAFCRLRPNKERKERDKNCCVCKEGLSVHWVGGWAA